MINLENISNPLKMREDFYGSYDPALHWDLFEKYLESFKNLERNSYIGGGSHFDSWKIQRPGTASQVVSISNQTFFQELGSKGLLDWATRMQLLKTTKIPLVPPFEILSRPENVAIMMPFGKIDKGKTKNPSIELKDEIETLVSELEGYSLAINDVLQIRFSESTPFVCDFSDLIELK